MPQIPDYTQAQTINTDDLFVIEQQDGTKKATVAQIAEKATAEVNEKIGDLSSLTTTNKDSLVDAVNEVDGKITAYNTTDFTDNAEYTWSQIIHAAGTTQFQIIRKGQIGIINVRFATSGAIDSGSLNIPNTPPTAYTEVRSAIASKDGKTGFIQYSGNTFVIRCQASSNVFAGSLVFPIG